MARLYRYENTRDVSLTLGSVFLVFTLAGCGGGGESGSVGEATNTGDSYTINGTVSGLRGSALVLQNNGGDDLPIASDGGFSFPTPVNDGDGYWVTVRNQPASPAGYCSVINGTGNVSGAAIDNISVHCVSGLYNLLDTMQTSCYDSMSGAEIACTGRGYDADYTGNQTDYTLSADRTVVYDNISGLAWTRSPDLTSDGQININDKLTQSEAVNYCAGLSYGGHTWRLPSIKELYSLIDFRGTDPSGYGGSDTSLLTPFIDDSLFMVGFGDTDAGERIIDGQAASSTLYVSPQGTLFGAGTMFGVNFIDGRIKGYPYNYPINNPKTFYVYCVSGNTDYGSNDFIDNGDGTITDNATGLRWQQDDYHASDFEDALTYCESAATGGRTNWRLPNVKELQSIVDYSLAPDFSNSPAIDPLFNATSFNNEEGSLDWGYYWTSTTHISFTNVGDVAAYVSFGRALGYFDEGGGLQLIDVHGAGAQRSNSKQSHAFDVSAADLGYGVFYYKGPQGDISRFDNIVRCVCDEI